MLEMMMLIRRHRTLACLAGVTLALSACGGGGDDDDGSSTGTTISPLAELMGWGNTSVDESNRKQLEVEELTAQCMREEGWEYTPVDYSAMNPMSPEDEEIMELQMNDPEAFGKRYGYGIVRNYELYDLPGIQAGDDGSPGVTVAPEFQDPNQPYVDSLSETEREQYYESLYGDQSAWEHSEDEDFVPPPPEEQGCQGTSSAAVWGDGPGGGDPDVQRRMDDFWQHVEDDPRLQDAYADWRDCMGDHIAGLAILDDPVDRPQDLYSYFDDRKWALMGLDAVPYEEGDDGDYAMVMTDADGTGVAYSGEQHAIAESDLEQLRQDELDMWRRDWDCAEEAGIAEIRHDLEQAFVDELRAEFPDLTTPAAEG